MYVCICRAMTEQEIQAAIELGADSMHALRSQLGVSTECGKCAPEIQKILNNYRRIHGHKVRRKS